MRSAPLSVDQVRWCRHVFNEVKEAYGQRARFWYKNAFGIEVVMRIVPT